MDEKVSQKFHTPISLTFFPKQKEKEEKMAVVPRCVSNYGSAIIKVMLLFFK